MVFSVKHKPADPKTAFCPECKSTRLLYSKGKLTCTNCGHIIGKTFSKYKSKQFIYNGNKYHSMYEANVAEDLDTRLRAGDIKAIERQVKIDLQAYGKHIANYYIDFKITHNDGHFEYIEAKGMETDVWKMKWKMFEAKMNLEEPGSELTVLKQRRYKKG